MIRRLTGTFVAGLLALLPLLITIAVVGFLVGKLQTWLGPGSAFYGWTQALSESVNIQPFWSYLISIIVVVVFICVVGYFARRVTGRRIGILVNELIGRIPFINKVYTSVEQVVGLIKQGGKGGAEAALSNVVLVRFANTRILGMLASPQTVDILGTPHYLVYFPSTPIPATGFNYLVPCEDVEDADVSVEDLTKILLSLGSLGPDILNAKSPLLLPRKSAEGSPAVQG
ncbi:DUF502 domain-containing protein [bacterium]|nr:DUF502 domain-containing protein [bacterium]